MTLQQLRYISMAAEKGSISEAAKELFVSQPSISETIRELENEIGFAIFLRSNKGISLTNEGSEFLGYARQVLEQSELLEQKYFGAKPSKQKFSVSTQHYSFAVNAFVDILEEFGEDEYEFTLRETRTHEIIEDVSRLRSEVGVLYFNDFNRKVLEKLIKERDLKFIELFVAVPHIFVSSSNPLAKQDVVLLEELERIPCLSFEQGEYNSFYFSEEILSTLERKKSIKVSDRATLFNLLIGLGGYTICTGIINEELNGKDIVSVPLKVKDYIQVGYLVHKDMHISTLGKAYIEGLKRHTVDLL